MNDTEALARRIIVRHKAPGHLRLELPPELCAAAPAAALEAGLRQLAGVYRVTLEGAARKLAIHFDPHLASLHDVARRLRALLDTLPAEAPAGAGLAAAGEHIRHSLAATKEAIEARARRAAARVRQTLRRLGRPAPPEGSLQARLQPLLASALTEKAMLNFLNDIVAFYLIKVHWDLLSQRWLKDPLKVRYAWLTTFYLVFLLVRFRKLNK